jgi:hypothetical protein
LVLLRWSARAAAAAAAAELGTDVFTRLLHACAPFVALHAGIWRRVGAFRERRIYSSPAVSRSLLDLLCAPHCSSDCARRRRRRARCRRCRAATARPLAFGVALRAGLWRSLALIADVVAWLPRGLALAIKALTPLRLHHHLR